MRKKTLIQVTITIAITTFLCTFMLIYKSELSDYYSYSRATLSYYGSEGEEVRQIQTRLSNWGYYNGSIDGIYGYKTFESVKRFQYINNLIVDGVAGPETLSALGLSTGQNNTANNNGVSTSKDEDLLAHLIHGEARGEPYVGQVAVGAVVLNRVKDSRFPKTVAGVIYQPGAFDAVDDGQINLAPNSTSYKAARDALNGWDPSYGCIYYYNPATATSKWIWSRPILLRIGKHNFAK